MSGAAENFSLWPLLKVAFLWFALSFHPSEHRHVPSRNAYSMVRNDVNLSSYNVHILQSCYALLLSPAAYCVIRGNFAPIDTKLSYDLHRKSCKRPPCQKSVALDQQIDKLCILTTCWWSLPLIISFRQIQSRKDLQQVLKTETTMF